MPTRSWLIIFTSRPAWLVPDTVLADSGGLTDSPAGWRSYLQFLSLMADEDKHARARKFEQLCSGWAIGSDGFKQLKKVTSVSNRWLAERLGMGGPGSVSSLITRFQREGRTERPEFQALHSRFAS